MNQMLNLSDRVKNILLMASGVILLLHALGLFACSLNTFVIAIGALLFVAGFVRGGYWDQVRGLISKK